MLDRANVALVNSANSSDRWRCTDGSVVLRFSGGFYGERHKWFNSDDAAECLLCVTGVPHCRSTEQRSAQLEVHRRFSAFHGGSMGEYGSVVTCFSGFYGERFD